jgi:hypothetical protein
MWAAALLDSGEQTLVSAPSPFSSLYFSHYRHTRIHTHFKRLVYCKRFSVIVLFTPPKVSGKKKINKKHQHGTPVNAQEGSASVVLQAAPGFC